MDINVALNRIRMATASAGFDFNETQVRKILQEFGTAIYNDAAAVCRLEKGNAQGWNAATRQCAFRLELKGITFAD